MSIEAGAALLIAAENEPPAAWLNVVEIPAAADGWGREAEDEKLKDQWERTLATTWPRVQLLYAACCLGDVEAVKLFLRPGLDPRGPREGGYPREAAAIRSVARAHFNEGARRSAPLRSWTPDGGHGGQRLPDQTRPQRAAWRRQ